MNRALRLLLLLGTGAVACSLLNPLDDYERPRAEIDSGTARPDASADVSADARCTLARPPERPVTDDGPEENEFVVATYSFGLDLPSDGGLAGFGFDLDGLCSCPEPGSCLPRGSQRPRCDGPGGVDNSGGVLLDSILKLVDGQRDLNSHLRNGEFSALLRIRRYNGKANDRDVEVAVFPSPGTAFPADAGVDDGGGDGGGKRKRPVPRWDGTDLWSVDPDAVVAGTAPDYAPRFVDPRAYVTNHVLVTTVELPLPLGFLTVDLRASILTARIVKNDAGAFMLDDAVLAGRWSTRSLLTALQEIGDPLQQGRSLCGDDPTYLAFKDEICASTDLTSDPTQDGKGAPCDAMSLTARAVALPARLGATEPSKPLQTPCGATYTDDCAN